MAERGRLRLKIGDYWEMRAKEIEAETRRHPRLFLNLPIEYQRINRNKLHPGYTFNASASGLMVNIPEKIDIGQHMQLTLFFSYGPELNSIEALSQVVWVGDGDRAGDYRSGVEFVAISPDHIGRLESFLRKVAPMM
jgi:hypothetical protein